MGVEVVGCVQGLWSLDRPPRTQRTEKRLAGETRPSQHRYLASKEMPNNSDDHFLIFIWCLVTRHDDFCTG